MEASASSESASFAAVQSRRIRESADTTLGSSVSSPLIGPSSASMTRANTTSSNSAPRSPPSDRPSVSKSAVPRSAPSPFRSTVASTLPPRSQTARRLPGPKGFPA